MTVLAVPLPSLVPPGLLAGLAPLADRLAVVLAAAAWQGVLVALAAASLLSAMARRSAAARHAVAMVALLAMLVLPVATTGAGGHGALAGAGAPFPSPVPAAATGTAVVGADAPAPTFPADAPPLPRGLVAAWALGAALMLARTASGLFAVQRLASSPAAPWPADWQARARRLQDRLGLRRRVALRLAPHADQPFTARVLRPVVWMPAALLARLDVAQLEALVAHELAHVRRLDALWHGLQVVAEALLFFHPAAWWLGHRIRQEREDACDDLAAAACGDGLQVAEALAALERARRTLPPMSMALAAADGPVLRRVRRLVSSPPSARPRGAVATAMLALMTLAGLLAAPAVTGAGQGAAPALATSTAAPPATAAASAVVAAPGATPAASTASGSSGTSADPWYTTVGDSILVRERGDDGHLREYHRWRGWNGDLHETWRIDGREAPIDAAARAWISQHPRPPAPPAPPAPPGMPGMPELPPVPDVPAVPAVPGLPDLPAPPPVPDVAPMPPIPAPPPPPRVSEHAGFQALQGWLAHDAGVVSLVGSPVRLGEDCRPCHIEDDRLRMDLSVTGPSGHARVQAEAHLEGSAWHFDRVDVRGQP